MGKFIAVMGCTLTTDNATAQAVIDTPPSTKVLAGAGCYSGDLDIMVSGAVLGTVSQSAPAIGKINASATKVLIDNKPAVLEGDKNLITIMADGLDSSTKLVVKDAFSFTVTITAAGQTSVQGS